MSSGLSDEFQLYFPDIKPLARVSNKYIINFNWIAGLARGNGCFYISIRNAFTTKVDKSLVLKFTIDQHGACSDTPIINVNVNINSW